MRAGHEAHKGDKINAYGVFVGKPEEKSLLQDLDAGGRIILK